MTARISSTGVALRARGLTKSFGDHAVVTAVDPTVGRGSLYGPQALVPAVLIARGDDQVRVWFLPMYAAAEMRPAVIADIA